jgi:glycosyltransferase involved in cell wall biosynthesis
MEYWDLRKLYGESAVLWAPRGYDIDDVLPEVGREHFGYTPIEAMAHYCLPIAYDAGGYQETTLLRWETLEELEQITKCALEDRDYWKQALSNNLEILWRFTQEQFVKRWQEIILSTNGLAWNRGVEWRRSDPRDIKVETVDISVGIVSEHPDLPTGYGLVCNQVGMGLKKAGFRVHILGTNGQIPDLERRFDSLWSVPRGVDPQAAMGPFFDSTKIDVALLMYSPFISGKLIHSISRHGGRHLPIVSFVSQEGAPAHSSWWNVLQRSRFCVTYCKAAADAIMARFGSEKLVEWTYLGVDHAPFRRYDDETRHVLRDMLGWDDLFIIFCVATNKRNKALWKHIQALRILHEKHGMDNARLLLHTNPIPDDRFGGIDIEMYAEMNGMNTRDDDVRRVFISPTGDDANPVPYESDLDVLFREEIPRSRRDFHKWFSKLGMIDRYNLADVYLDLSSVEGFGIPLFEAMACGLPAVTIDDRFVRREVISQNDGLLHAEPLDVWTTGADMMLARPGDAALVINNFAKCGAASGVIQGESASRVVEKLKWGNTSDKIAEVVGRCLL